MQRYKGYFNILVSFKQVYEGAVRVSIFSGLF